MSIRAVPLIIRSSIVLALVLASAPLRALGLGDIRLESTLGSPLRATIEIGSMGAVGASEVLVGAASETVYRDYGVEKAAYTGSLRYAIDVDAKGSAVVHVSSPQPITEPMVDMVVELKWPSGRSVKHYTLLLDPPAR
ncbi:MAG: FimV family protein [Gammaproteobacteria bacterium]